MKHSNTQEQQRRVKMKQRKHTRDTNITLDKGKQRYKVIEIGLRPTKADAPIKRKSNLRRIKNMCRTMKELENAVADYRSLKAMKEQLEEELKAVEREIIGYMDTNEKVSETGNDFTIKLSTCERRTLDSKRLEADLGSLAEYQRISQYRRLYVK